MEPFVVTQIVHGLTKPQVPGKWESMPEGMIADLTDIYSVSGTLCWLGTQFIVISLDLWSPCVMAGLVPVLKIKDENVCSSIQRDVAKVTWQRMMSVVILSSCELLSTLATAPHVPMCEKSHVSVTTCIPEPVGLGVLVAGRSVPGDFP